MSFRSVIIAGGMGQGGGIPPPVIPPVDPNDPSVETFRLLGDSGAYILQQNGNYILVLPGEMPPPDVVDPGDPDPPLGPDPGFGYRLLLEDGYRMLLEDGVGYATETVYVVPGAFRLLLEDGFTLRMENGDAFLRNGV